MPSVTATREPRNQAAGHRPLKQPHKLINGEPGLADNRSERPSFEISSRVDRNRDGPPWICWVREHVMAAGNPIDDKARFGEGSNDLPAIEDRQSPAVHGYAAMVTRRISGRASVGIAMP